MANPRTGGDRLPHHHREPGLQLVGQGRLHARCPACRAAGLQVMRFAMTNGDVAELRRCGSCEWRSWYCNDHQVALIDVLSAVQSSGLPRAPRRRKAS